jgi:hypothetical protein
MDKTRILERRARQLIGEKVRITCKKATQPYPNFHLSPYTFQATLEGVERNSLKIRKETGMIYTINIKDEYMVIEDIKPADQHMGKA